MSSLLVPHGPLLVRFTNDNINTLNKKKKRNSILIWKELWRESKGEAGRIWLGPTSNKTAEVSVMRFGKCVQCLGARVYLTCQRDCLPNGQRARGLAGLSRHSLPTTYVVLNLLRNEEIWVFLSAPDKWGQLIKILSLIHPATWPLIFNLNEIKWNSLSASQLAIAWKFPWWSLSWKY